MGTEGVLAQGWYTDPYDSSRQRYFDGGAWTEHIFAQGRQTTAPATPTYASQPSMVPPYAQARTTNGLAIASMVLGIVWIYWIGSILALVFGYVAKGQIKQQGQAGGGMATAGIILGWIGVGTLVIMIGLLTLGSN